MTHTHIVNEVHNNHQSGVSYGNIVNRGSLKIDSGISGIDACVNDANVVHDFIQSNTSDVELRSATNNELNVIGHGTVNINNVPIQTHVCSNLVENLISSHVLTQHPLNLWLVFPPKKLGGGVIGIDEIGKVIVTTDADYHIHTPTIHIPKVVYKKSNDIINVVKRSIHDSNTLNDSYTKYNTSYAMINDVHTCNIYSLHSNIDTTKLSPSDLVRRTQQRFFTFSKGALLDLARSGAIANFPVTPAQLRAFWHENVPHILGTFSKPSVRHFPRARGEPGDIVSTDRLGPITPVTIGKHDGIHVFIDYATLYLMIVLSKSQTASDLATIMETVSKKYALHNHRIKRMRQDALPAAMAPATEEMADQLAIRQEFRSPHHHEGSDENAARHLSDSICVAFSGAPHMPRQLWGYAAVLSTILYNLRLEPGGSRMTRMQAFTGNVPDWNRLPIGVFGAPYAVLLDKDSQREWKFDSHACIAAYLCPDTRGVVDTHFFYRLDVKTVIRRCQYRALKDYPEEWKSSKPDVNIKIKQEDNELQLNWQATQDGSHIFEPIYWEGDYPTVSSTDSTVNTQLADSQLVDNARATTEDTRTNLLSPTRSITVSNGEPLHGSAHGLGDHANIGSPQHMAAVQERVTGGRGGESRVNLGALPTVETSTPVAINLFDSFNAHDNEVSMSNANITGVSVDITGVSTDTSIQGNVQQVKGSPMEDGGRYKTSYVNTIKQVNDGEYVLECLPQHKTHMKLAYDTININHVNWITPIRPSLLKHSYDDVLSNPITEPIRDPSNYLPPPIDVPKPTRQERRRLILKINKVMRKDKVNIKKKKKKLIYDPDAPNIRQALESEDRAEWIAAIQKELEQLELEKIWEVVTTIPHYARDKVIPSHITLLKKRLADGTLDKYKARLVAGGHRQVCEEYSITTSPTARATSVKLLFSIAAKTGMHTRTFDVKGAYLKADIEEEVYMILPKFDNNEPNKYVKLIKNLYGLKTAGAAWYKLLNKTLLEHGCIQCPYDPCVYLYNDDNDNTLRICIHVDDLLLTCSNNDTIDNFANFLRSVFTDVNEVTHTNTHLGILIEHNDAGDIKLSQPGYIRKIVKHCNLENNNSFPNTPYDLSTNSLPDMTPYDISKYRSIIGLLNHAAIHTRPDILYITSELASKLTNPTVNDYHAAIRVVKYLHGSMNLGLTFNSHGPVELYAYVDASYNSHPDAKGHSGICFSLGTNDASFQSISRKHKLVVRSSTEAEFLAIDSCVVEVEWLRCMLEFFDYKPTSPTVIFQDNLSTMHIANTESHTMRTKHYNMRYHYIKQAIAEHSVILQYISTDDHTADILTKRLSSAKSFIYLRSKLMNC